MKREILLTVCIVCGVGAQEFNAIDAVSSASGKYKVLSGKAYADRAELTCYGRYANGTMGIVWGTTQAMTGGSASIPVASLPQSNTVVRLSSLKANTTYYFRLHGAWNGRTFNDLGSGSFVTARGVVTFRLTVNKGTGSGEYESGTRVTVRADSPSERETFAGWAGDIRFLDDPELSSTTALMPAQDVTLTAEYAQITALHPLPEGHTAASSAVLGLSPHSCNLRIETADHYSLSVYAINGRCLYSGNFHFGQGLQRVPLQRAALTHGTYLVNLHSTRERRCATMIVE